MGSQYSPAEVDAALTTLAYYGGNAARTSQETGIPAMTLKDWRNRTHRERYLEIQEREGPKLEAIAAGHAREVILRAAEIEHNVLDRLTDNTLSTKELAEAAGAFQRVTTAKGINTTKLLELTGRPTSIVEHREGNEILRSLAAKVPGLILDSTAEELPPPQALTSETVAANARETTVDRA